MNVMCSSFWKRIWTTYCSFKQQQQQKIKPDTTTIHNNRNSHYVAYVGDYYGEVSLNYSIQIWKPEVKRNML